MTDLIPLAPGLTWAEARRSPCAACPQSYCCTHVPLHQFALRTVLHVDQAGYLLNFEGILLGLDSELVVTVYLNQPCTHLDQPSGLCTVHGTDLQPGECRHYPAFACDYRHRMADGNDPEHLLLDRARFDWLASTLYFDDLRDLVAGSEWPDTVAGVSAIPLSRRPAPMPPPDPAMAEWQDVVIGRKAPSERSRAVRYDDLAVQQPCAGCAAYCCQVLVFNQDIPTHLADLDRIRYLLGFPSIELAVADGDWSILVHTRCRHLAGTECGVFGQPERPLKCAALPSVGCEYKPMLGDYDPDRQLRIRADLFPVLQNALAYASDGTVLGVPPVSLINQLMQNALRAGVR